MTTPAIGLTSTLQTTPATIDSDTLINGTDNAELLQWVNKQYRLMVNSRKSVERQWYINLAFYFGKQNVQVQTVSSSSGAFRLVLPQAPPWRVRLVINRIRPIIRKEIANLFGQKPRFDVVPAGTEDLDFVAARAGEQIFDYVYDGKEVKTKLKQAGWWACITGTGFIKTWWDPNIQDTLSKKPGDLCIEPVTPFNLYIPNMRALEVEDQPYIIHAATHDESWVNTKFPDIKGYETTTEAILQDSFMNMPSNTNMQSTQVLVLECWIKPGCHKKLPNGGMITVVGGKVAYITKTYPYEHGRYPFKKVVNIPSGKFYGEAMLTDLVPIQKEFNRTRSQIVEAKNLLGKPKLMAQRGSIDPSKVTSEPGQVILVNLGFQMPEALQLPPLPEYVVQSLDLLLTDMSDISGMHEVSNGQNPAQVTSATALSFLQEQDDTMLSDTTDSLESAVQATGRDVLALCQQYWTIGRKIKILGTDGAFDATVLSGADLRGNTDLRVESGSALPTSKAAKLALIMDLIKMAIIPPQQALEMMEIGGIEKVYDDYLADKRQAQRENLRMEAGATDLLANEFDNHAVHIVVHNRFRKSQTYETLPVENKREFQNHVMAHMAALQNQNSGDPTGANTGQGNEQGQLPPSPDAIDPSNMPPPNAIPSGGAPSPDTMDSSQGAPMPALMGG